MVQSAAFNLIYPRERGRETFQSIMFYTKATARLLIFSLLIAICYGRELALDVPIPQARPMSVAPILQKARQAEGSLTAGDSFFLTVGTNRIALRWIPSGHFIMGSPVLEPYRDTDEIQHQVTLKHGFFLAETECPQSLWEKVMGTNPSHGKGLDLAVNQVNWKEILKFCDTLTTLHREQGILPVGCRWSLPTEAQWEYACRARTVGAYAGNLDEMAWLEGNSKGKSHPVGSKKPNDWGLYDMHGSAAEWCRDGYIAYTTNSVIDPVGSESIDSKCVRGGNWLYGDRRCRSAARGTMSSGVKGDYIGFRLLLSLQ